MIPEVSAIYLHQLFCHMCRYPFSYVYSGMGCGGSNFSRVSQISTTSMSSSSFWWILGHSKARLLSQSKFWFFFNMSSWLDMPEKMSEGSHLGGIIIRCPNNLSWLLSMQYPSSFMSTAEPSHPTEEPNFSRLYP